MSGTGTAGGTDRVATVTCSCGSTDTVTARWSAVLNAWSIPMNLVGDHVGHTVRAELHGWVGATP